MKTILQILHQLQKINYKKDISAILFLVFVSGIFFLPDFIAKDFVGDFVAQHLPHTHFIMSWIKRGEVPFWFPFAYLGTPEFFKPELAFFHPTMLFTLILNFILNHKNSLSGTGQLMELTTWLTWTIGASGMYLFVRRRLGLSYSAAIFSSIVFFLTPAMLNTLRTITYMGYALLPWMFYSLVGFYESRRLRWFIALIFCNYCMIAGGYPYFWVYFSLAQLGLACFWNWRSLLPTIAALGLAVLLSAFYLFPGLYVFMQSTRGSAEAGTSKVFHVGMSTIPSRFFTLINPLPFGDNYNTVDSKSLLSPIQITWGVVPFVFLLIGLFYAPSTIYKKYFMALLLISFMYSFGGYVSIQDFVGRILPVIQKFRSHAQGLTLTLFAGSVFVGIGWDVVWRRRIFPRKLLLGLLSICVCVYVVITLLPSLCIQCVQNNNQNFQSLSISVFLLFASVLIVFALRRQRSVGYFVIILFLTLSEFTNYYQNLNGFFADYTYRQFHGVNSLIPEIPSQTNLFRIDFVSNQFSYNTGNLGVYNYAGYESTPLQHWYYSQSLMGYFAHLQFSNVRYLVSTEADVPLRFASAKLVGTIDPKEHRGETFISDEAGYAFSTSHSTHTHYIYRIENSLPRFFAPDSVVFCHFPQCPGVSYPFSTVTAEGNSPPFTSNPKLKPDISVTSYSPNVIRLKVTGKQKQFIASSELWDSGWSAQVNGKPVEILRVLNSFRGVFVPSGESIVEYRYWPPGFNLGAITTILTLAFLSFIVFYYKKSTRIHSYVTLFLHLGK